MAKFKNFQPEENFDEYDPSPYTEISDREPLVNPSTSQNAEPEEEQQFSMPMNDARTTMNSLEEYYRNKQQSIPLSEKVTNSVKSRRNPQTSRFNINQNVTGLKEFPPVQKLRFSTGRGEGLEMNQIPRPEGNQEQESQQPGEFYDGNLPPSELEINQDVPGLKEFPPYHKIRYRHGLEMNQIPTPEGNPEPEAQEPGSVDPPPPPPPLNEGDRSPAHISYGNYALAGAMGSRGALPPLSGEAVGNAINARDQYENTNRAAVRAAVFSSMNARREKALDRQNRLDAVEKRNKATGNTLLPNGKTQAQANDDRRYELNKRGVDNKIEEQANKDYTSVTSPYISTLESSRRLGDVLDDVTSGKSDRLKTSKSIAAAMASDMSQLLTNQKGTTVSDKEHAAISSAMGTWADIQSFVGNHPNDTIPPEYLAQMKKELEILKHSTMQSFEARHNELVKGTKDPEKIRVFTDRFNSQMNNYKTKGPKSPNMRTITDGGRTFDVELGPDGKYHEVIK